MNLACSSSRSNVLYYTVNEGDVRRERVTPWSHPDSAPSQKGGKGVPLPQDRNENSCWVIMKPRNGIIVLKSIITFNSMLLYVSRNTAKSQKGSHIHKSSTNSKFPWRLGTPLPLSKSAWVAQAPQNTSPWNSLLQSSKSEESEIKKNSRITNNFPGSFINWNCWVK